MSLYDAGVGLGIPESVGVLLLDQVEVVLIDRDQESVCVIIALHQQRVAGQDRGGALPLRVVERPERGRLEPASGRRSVEDFGACLLPPCS